MRLQISLKRVQLQLSLLILGFLRQSWRKARELSFLSMKERTIVRWELLLLSILEMYLETPTQTAMKKYCYKIRAMPHKMDLCHRETLAPMDHLMVLTKTINRL